LGKRRADRREALTMDKPRSPAAPRPAPDDPPARPTRPNARDPGAPRRSGNTSTPNTPNTRPLARDSQPPRDPVDRQLFAYNAHDLAAFLACYAPDVMVYDNEGRITAENRAQMQATYETLFARSPRVRARIRQRIRLGPPERQVVIDEEHVSGYVSGGAEKRFVLAVMYEVEGELIRVVRFLTPPYPKAPRHEPAR
jgi:hypothetical protein